MNYFTVESKFSSAFMASFSIPILAKISHSLSVPIPCANFQPIPLASKQTRDKWGSATKSGRGSGMLSNLLSCSVVSDSLWPLGSNRLLYPWNYPKRNTGVGCHFWLQGIFLNQRWKPCLLHWQAGPVPQALLESPNLGYIHLYIPES